jgi:hypothetical protein
MAFCELFEAIATGYDFPEPAPFRENRHHIERKHQRWQEISEWATKVRRHRRKTRADYEKHKKKYFTATY